ncbi:MAG: PAS domain S-box protein [Gammaproteobacteria bacterium]|nr:PAS domain S-box protein [Gammaproteobacteria bacterium]MDH4253450.1 PAS domain S-box protein [Gammaproteobacteria bacterium]MDH5309188.1 PAS domain S-box protein [Gammaproteobacteria bacterium]
MKVTADIASQILNSSADAMLLVDEAGAILFANRSAAELFGYASDEMIGKAVETLMPESFRKAHQKHREAYGRRPRARPLISGLMLLGLRKNGETFELDIALTPLETDQGMVVATTLREISREDASETYFRNLLESAPDAMIIVDDHGKVAIVNHQAEQMFGYTREEMLGSDIEALLPTRFRERHVGHRDAYLESPHVRPMGAGLELLGRRKDGSEFPVEISLSPVRHSAGTFVSSVIRDVTRRKQMEAELIAARQAAERANKANTAFLAAASHDLRQPVQALSLLNGALRRTVKDPLARDMLESQQHSLDAMTNLLNSLLDISRLDAGAVEPELEDFPIQRLVDRLSAEFGRQASHKGLVFTSCECDCLVRSDPNLLGEIIQNFVSNAIRYTQKGSVSMSCVPSGSELRIDVRDTGIGIEADQLDAIFKEFHQCKTPGAEQEGFGLGLAIVRRLADLLGHKITVESVPGHGSCFSVHLPLVEGRAPVDGDADILDDEDLVEDASGTIILIEDDFAVANAWGLLLEAEGHRVATAQSATEARAIVRHLDHAPDLVISDFHLIDGSTGVDAVKEIRDEFGFSVPAFIVSGDTSKVVDAARDLENCALMSKPVNTDTLLKRVRHAVLMGSVGED